MGVLKRSSNPNATPGCTNPASGGVLSCPATCDIVLRDYSDNPITVSGLSGTRLMDNGEYTGALTYTTDVIDYGSITRGFNIEYDRSTKIITALVKIKLKPYDIHLVDIATGATKNDASGSPEIVPYYWNKTKDGEPDGSGYKYKYVTRTISSTFLSQLKSNVEGTLNSPNYFLIPDPCCAKLTPCEHKVAIKFEVEAGESVTSSHEQVNLFSISDRADSGNWSETINYTGDDVYRICAHEIGHLFGWPDEYFRSGGAVHKMYIDADQKVDQTMTEPADDWKREGGNNLMKSGRDIQPYYMCHIEEWFERRTSKQWKVTT